MGWSNALKAREEVDECLTIKLSDCFEVANEFHLTSIEQSSVLTHIGALRDFRLSKSGVWLTTKSASDEFSCKMAMSLLLSGSRTARARNQDASLCCGKMKASVR